MDIGGINPAVLIASLMVASVPIMLAAIGELVVEKAGVLNLGVEGMMIIGAICGFMAAVHSGSPLVGFVGGALGGAALSLVFAVLTQVLLTNQVATGLALTLFGLGLSSLLGAAGAAGGHPLLRPGPVQPRLGGLSVHCRGRGGLGRPEVHAHRPDPAGGGRKPRCRPCAGLQGGAHPGAGHPVRGGDGGAGRGLACRNGPTGSRRGPGGSPWPSSSLRVGNRGVCCLAPIFSAALLCFSLICRQPGRLYRWSTCR